MGTVDALMASLVEHRDDRAAWAVLGDALQTEGDPRGALVNLMLAREARPSRQLLEAEREHRARFETLAMTDIVWRRGFAIGLRVTSVEALAKAIADPMMMFLESVVIEIAGEQWTDLLELLATTPQPWRRFVVKLGTCEEPIALAPLFARLPAVEHVRVVADGVEIDWAACRAPRLRRLELYGLDEIAFDELDMPALQELRLFGSSSPGGLRTSALWERLQRVVIEGDAGGLADSKQPSVHVYDVEDPEYTPNAFVVAGGEISTALVTELVAKIGGVESIAANIAVLDWPVVVTAIRLRSSEPISLMPYALGAALERHLGRSARVALVGIYGSADSASMNVLGRESYEPRVSFGERNELVRSTLDRLLGRDPGPEILSELERALDCVPEITLVGEAAYSTTTLLEIDPTEPPPSPPDDDYDDYDQDGEPQSNDLLDHIENDFYDDPEADYDVIPGAEPEPEVEDITVDVPVVAVVETEAAESVVEPPVDESTEESPNETPDDGDAWQRLDDQWLGRETDPDDDASERWPDPEWKPFVEIEQLIDVPSCATCKRIQLVRPCSMCGALNCAECALEDERDQVTCKACLDDLLAPPAAAPDDGSSAPEVD